MDPLSVTAAVIGITAPTLHWLHVLLREVENAANASSTIQKLKADLCSVEQALKALQTVTDIQWSSLSEDLQKHAAFEISKCKEACEAFSIKLNSWTRRSISGQAMVGVFKQRHIQSISRQLRDCQINITTVTSIATLIRSLKNEPTQEIISAITTKGTEITNLITEVDRRLADVVIQSQELRVTERVEPPETEADRNDAISQISVEQSALERSSSLLKELDQDAKSAVHNLWQSQAGSTVVNNFGGQNQGMQIGTNHGAISGITFGTR